MKNYGLPLLGKFYIIVLILAGIFSVSAAGEVDLSFNAAAYGLTNGTVHIIKKQPDGKYLVGGNFTDVNGHAASGLARLNADLSVDTSFNTPDFGNGGGMGGTIYALGIQSDGKIIVGGDFNGIDNVFNPGLKRLLPNGALDTSFQSLPPPSHFPYTRTVNDLEVLANDKIVVGGNYEVQSGTFGFFQLNADGTLDNGFTAGSGSVKEVEIQPDGKILAAFNSLSRYNSNGTVDGTFTQVTTNGTIEAVRIRNDGNIFIGGGFTLVNGFQQGGISKINSDGSLDLTFNQNNPGANGIIFDIIIKTDNKFLICGSFTSYNTTQRQKLAQLNADGTLDVSFQNNPSLNAFTATDIEILSDGKLLVGFSPSATVSSLIRFNADGSIDNSLNEVVSRGGRVRRMTQQPDGKILIVGQFKYANGVVRNGMARLNTDGSLDTSFVPYFSIIQNLTGVALQPDGKIIVGGFNGEVLRRLNADGSLDTSFVTTLQTSTNIYDVAVLPNGQILAVGDIFSGTTRRIARFNSNGTLDTTFAATQPDATVYKVAVQPDGKILIGGAFTQIGATLRGRIARLNSDGSLDNTFNPPGGANNEVYNFDLQADGKVVLAGVFTGLNGSSNYQRIGRLNADGSLDGSFVQSAVINTPIVGLEVQPDGKILVGGSFSLIGGTSKLGLARFNSNGTLDAAFNPYINGAIPANLAVLDIYLQTDGKILVGGEFTKMNGISRVRIARLLNSIAPARTLFDYDGDGKADVSVFRASENKWYILRSSDFQVVQQVFAVPGDVIAPSDYDGDGKTDIAIFRPSSGDWWYLSSLTNTQTNVHFGQSGDIPRPSDFDGDGKADFIVYRPSNSVWYRFGSTGVVQSTAFGIAEDKPLVGDFDGDGKSDLAIFRPSTGDWWYAASGSGGTFRATHWGQTGDIPVPADYDGDGKTDFAVFRPSNGGWYILNSSNGSIITTAFGLAEDKPVAADYDGDGKADIAVFRPSTGIWYLLQTTAGFGGVQFGVSTDIPTPKAFLP